MNKTLIILGIVILAAAVLGGMYWIFKRPFAKSAVVPETTPVVTAVSTPPPANVLEEPSGKVVEVTVTGSSFKFVPDTIEARKGDTIRVLFKSTGTMLHDFVIDEFGVATSQLGDGEEEEVEFVADKSGTFEFYCSVGNHRTQGMKGTLVVN